MALDRRSALYQLDKKNKKIPIQFISKKLNETELKWNIVEKEAYPICNLLLNDETRSPFTGSTLHFTDRLKKS